MQVSAVRLSRLLSLLLLACGSANAFAEPVMVVPGHYIIQKKLTRVASARASTENTYTVHRSTPSIQVVTLKGSTARLKSNANTHEPLDWSKVRRDCEEIKKDTSVETCEPDIIRKLQALPNDPGFADQWSLRDLVNAADIGAETAWNVSTGNTETLIGVIDSGIYRQHEDLSANLWSNPNEPVDGIDNDGNGYVDDINGVNSDSGSGDVSDCNGHGTHVSGIIGARGNNGVGVSGVNWVTSLVVVNTDRGDCSGSASVSSIIAAYDYFYDLRQRGHAVRVINASFGGEGEIAAEQQAIQRLGSVDVLLVAAAGNDNRELDSFPSYPASYELPNIITVGATGPTRLRAAYSNFGQSVDIAAPGGDSDYGGGTILSTYSPDASGGALYSGLEGTSMATPMVTGAIGLLASLKSYLTGEQLKQILLETATSVPALDGSVAAGRFLNLSAMVGSDDPADQCPSDPNKLSPGVCGCGVVDSYADSDSDLTLDCVDGCPSDSLKAAAGVCGCGLSDGDSNGNGQADCLDPYVADIVPARPKLSVVRSNLLVSMSEKSNVEYLIELSVTKPRSGGRTPKPRISYYLSSSARGLIRKPTRGSSVRVRYAYQVIGSSTDYSQWSAAARLKVVK